MKANVRSILCTVAILLASILLGAAEQLGARADNAKSASDACPLPSKNSRISRF
jgi:hypothetical protein